MDLRFQRDIYHGGTLRRDSGQATNPQMTQICNHEKREQTNSPQRHDESTDDAD